MPELTTGPDLTAGAELSIGTLRLPARVHFGYGARAQLAPAVRVHGGRVLVVVDPFLTRTELVSQLIASLADQQVQIYDDITAELPVDTLDAAGAIARDFGPDVVVAIGGGSALDAAKLIALLCAHPGPLDRYYGENLVPGPVTPIIALPTTAGTGSEVTPVAVVSDPARELKVGISSPFLVPVAAIVDPELTLGAPARVSAYSGIDALVHAVESYTARPLPPDWSGPLPVFTGRNALADPIALRAARALGPWLPVAVAEPGHRPAREQVALGALLGGMAFGSTGTHLCHALQYAVGALTKTPHGLGTGLLLPHVLNTIRADPAVADRLATFDAALEGPSDAGTAGTSTAEAGSAATSTTGAAAFGTAALGTGALGTGVNGTGVQGASASAPASAERLVARIAEINRQIGVPATLAEIGLSRADLPRIAELGARSTRLLAIAPVEPTPELLLDILHRAYHADRSAP